MDTFRARLVGHHRRIQPPATVPPGDGKSARPRPRSRSCERAVHQVVPEEREAVLRTGSIPDGLIDNFQNNTGHLQADMLRLNTAIPPAEVPNGFGPFGGDAPQTRRPWPTARGRILRLVSQLER